MPSYIGRGSAYLVDGSGDLAIADLEHVVDECTRAIERDPEDIRACIHRGLAYAALGDTESATAGFEEGIGSDPGRANLEFEQSVEAVDQGPPEITMSDRGLAVAYYSYGLAQYALRYPIDAAYYLSMAASYFEGNVDRSRAYHALGRAHQAVWMLNDALQAYDRAIQLDPTNAAAYFSRAMSHYWDGDLEAAIADFSHAIDHYTEDSLKSMAYVNRGECFRYLGDLESAIADCSRAIELHPDNPSAYHSRGIPYCHAGDLQASIADYYQALDLFTDEYSQSAVYSDLGLSLRAPGDLAAAIEALDRSIELNRGNAIAYFNRGLTRYDRGDADKAIADLNRALESTEYESFRARIAEVLDLIKGSD
jgi:tetratricopeptide (TPR) repeat protein